jgi:hypothetical protein
MGNNLLQTDEIVTILAAGPGKIRAAVATLTDEELAERLEPEEWSPNEILAHLRACQDVWGDSRIARMLAEDHPTMRAVNPRTWLEQADYRELPFRRSLEAFAAQRDAFLRVIGELSPEQWMRAGTFTGGGRPREYTVQTEADGLARHERSHIRQIERLCRAKSRP